MNLNLLLRKYFSMVCNFLFLAPPFWKKNLDFFIVVDYHYITDLELQNPNLEVQSKILDEQLKFFSEHMNIIDPRYFNDDFFKRSDLSTPSILVTIDDADYSLKENIHLFKKYKIPIIIFAPFGLCLEKNSRNGLMSRIFRAYFENTENNDMGEKKEFFDNVSSCSDEELLSLYKDVESKRNAKDPLSNRKLLTIQELSELSKDPLITISSHSMSHPVLSKVPNNWLQWEINTCLEYLDKINGERKFFAYPYGYKESINESVKQCLNNAGVKYAFSTRSRSIEANTDHLEFGRVGMLNFSNKRYLKGLTGKAFQYFDMLLKR